MDKCVHFKDELMCVMTKKKKKNKIKDTCKTSEA